MNNIQMERLGSHVHNWLSQQKLSEPYAVVVSKNFNKGGSAHNHAHSLGVAQLQPRP